MNSSSLPLPQLSYSLALNFLKSIGPISILGCLFWACSDTNETENLESPIAGEVMCTGEAICQGDLALYCVGTPQSYSVDCGANGQRCERGIGCTLCQANQLSCVGNEVVQCSADGQQQSSVMICPDQCFNGRCTTPCQREADEKSYQGCEYWPTPLSNSVGLGFSFAIGVVNVNGATVTATIKRGDEVIEVREIPPLELEVITLPWIDELTYNATVGFDDLQGSSLVSQGAYQLTTTLPVIAYQFNPLEYQRAEDCPQENDSDPNDGRCFSYSNDASLLLPAHAFGQEYLVSSYPSLSLDIPTGIVTNPSTFQVVGTAPGVTDVSVLFSSASAASLNGNLPSYEAGERALFKLNQGDVLQIAGRPSSSCQNPVPANPEVDHCEVGAEGDLSGTIIETSQPVEVFGSHTCAFIPYNVFACDHLEESLFPIRSWGRSVVVPVTQSLINEPNVIRVMSASDGNQINFSPPTVHPSVTLNKGQSVSFETRTSLIVNGTGPLQVSQFLVGQNYSNAQNENGFGDPSMSLIPPPDQFRTSYKVLAPETYALHYLNLVTRAGSEVTLDQTTLPPGQPIADSNWESHTIEVTGGVHELRGADPFGVWVYGFGSYTSYMYPGGLDLKEINDVE